MSVIIMERHSAVNSFTMRPTPLQITSYLVVIGELAVYFGCIY